MNAYEEAHNLARAIKESQEFIQFEELKKKIEENPELDKIVKDYEKKQFELQAKISTGEITAEDAQKEIMNLSQVLIKDPTTALYLQAQVRFSIMMGDIYKILGDAIGIGNLM